MTENLQKTFVDYLGRTTVSKNYDEDFQWKVGSFFLREPQLLEKIDYPVGKYIDFEGIGKSLRWNIKEAHAWDYKSILDSTSCSLEFDDYDNGRQIFDCLGYDNLLVFFDELCEPIKLGNDILNDSRFQPISEDNKFIGLQIAG